MDFILDLVHMQFIYNINNRGRRGKPVSPVSCHPAAATGITEIPTETVSIVLFMTNIL